MASRMHNLHELAQLPDAAGSTGWGCRCGHTGTAPTADLAVEGHAVHVDEATRTLRAITAVDPTSIYATEETPC